MKKLLATLCAGMALCLLASCNEEQGVVKVCRGGASTLSELTAIGKPAVIVPSPNVHNPPHFHAEYGGFKALINIQEACVIRGALPARQLKSVIAWCLVPNISLSYHYIA